MRHERWEQIKRICYEALQRESSPRRVFLDEACAGDDSLRKEVDSLLAQRLKAEDFIEAPAMDVAARQLAADREEESDFDLVGRTLLHYYIAEKIGQGGMGIVYKALDKHLGRSVAIKILPAGAMADRERKRRFVQEARAASSLNHPNIIQIYDINVDAGIDFIVMEHVSGIALDKLILPKSLNMAEALNYAAQIAEALTAAHKAGIVHRDLKPANIMVTENGLIKVLDFGLAKHLHPLSGGLSGTVSPMKSLTEKGGIMGTIAYMSPEQLRDKAVDARSDIFAFGLVLYELLTGVHPFRKESPMETGSAILNEEAEPAGAITEGIPPDLEKLIGRCLQKNPDLRFQHIGEVRNELAALQNPDFSRALQPCVLPDAPKDELLTSNPARHECLESKLIAIAARDGREAPVAKAEPARKKKIRLRIYILAAGVLFLFGAAWWAAKVVRSPNILFSSQAKFTPFATSLPTQVCPSWSPDGKNIAFTTSESGRSRLMVQALGSYTPKAVTTPEVSILGGGDLVRCRQPLWSPDSKWLYFVGSIGRRDGLFRVAANGGDATLVQDGAVAATISPDGRTVAFLARSDQDKRYRAWTASPPEALRQMYRPPPFDAAEYFNIPQLAFSPDGKGILLIIRTEAGNLCSLLPWPPREPRHLFAAAERALNTPKVSWMPDSQHVIIAMAGSLAMADIRSQRYWPVAVQDRPMLSPAASPDGSRVAYQSSLSHSDVIAVPLGGGPVKTLLGSSAWEQMPGASPVAPRIVYVTNKRGPMEIWIKNLEDGWDRPLISPQDIRVSGEKVQLIMAPIFSPDGLRVAFAAGSPAGVALFTINASGGTPVRATSVAELSEVAPTWSPDGMWLVFMHGTSNGLHLAKVRLGSGQPPVDLAPTCGTTVPAWSPGGEWIAYAGPDCVSSLISPDGRQTRTLGGAGTVAWSHDGKTLYRIDSPSHSLVSVDIGTLREQTVRDLGDLLPFSGPQPGLRASLTSDGASIVYSVLKPREEIWILEGFHINEPWYAWLLSLFQ